MEEGANLLGFTPSYAHVLLVEMYGDFLHNNDGMHLYGIVSDDTICHHC